MSLKAVHQHFELVTRKLGSGLSTRCKIFLVDEFLAAAETDISLYESYLIELSEYLPSLNRPEQLTGLNPDRLKGCFRRIDRLLQQHPKVADLENYYQYRDQLRFLTALLYGFCGELREIYNLYEPDSSELPEWTGVDGSPERRLNQARQLIRDAQSPWKGRLLQIIEARNQLTSTTQNSACLPVIETCSITRHVEVSGRLSRLEVQDYSPSSDQKDHLKIRPEYRLHGAEQYSPELFDHVMQAAHQQLRRQFAAAVTKPYQATLRFNPEEVGHEGRSSELAMTCLYYNLLVHRHDPRCELKIHPDACLTGSIREDGTITEVDPETLELKVEAVFFSPKSTLIVPLDQLHEAEEVAGSLTNRYPGKSLTVIGVRNLSDLVNDRRIIIRKHTPALQHYARQAWSRKFSAASLVIIAILSLIIFRLYYGPMDREPVAAEFEGAYMHIQNSAGQKLETIEVGRLTARLAGRVRNQPVDFIDITGDGYREVIWAVNAAREDTTLDMIYAKSLRGDSLLWSKEFYMDIEYPNSPGVFSRHYRIDTIEADYFGYDEPVFIALAKQPTFFPTTITVFSANSGEILQQYLHAGRLKDMVLHDITGNGTEEIIATGVNNSFDQAIITILDPTNLQGQSPHTRQYKAYGWHGAEHLAYIRIPKTKLGKSLRFTSRYSEGTRLNIYENESILRAYINDFSGSTVDHLDVEQARVIAYFDFELNPRGFGTHNDYDLASRQLLEEGYIDEIPDYRYFEEFKNEIIYLKDGDWMRYGDK